MIKTHLLLFLVISPFLLSAQFGNSEDKPNIFTQSINTNTIAQENIVNPFIKASGTKPYFETAEPINTQIDFSKFVLTNVKPNGDKIYHLKIHADKSEGMMFTFKNLKLTPECKLWIVNINTDEYAGAYTQKDVDENDELITTAVIGNELLVEYLEPSNYITPNFSITSIYHFYENTLIPIKSSLSCMSEASCNQDAIYENARIATCKIVMVNKNNIGYCTGTLINNTNNDGTPYIITANHCADEDAVTNYNNWEFHFNKEVVGCDNKVRSNVIVIKGSQLIARSSPFYTSGESDFLLVKLNKTIPASLNLALLGWDIDTGITVDGACYHHPLGDVKKISKYKTKPVISMTNNSLRIGTHLKVQWTKMDKEISVTHGGSSGSALLNNKGLIVGTLTGGYSSCTKLDGYDFYGRMFFHWNLNDSTPNHSLKKWLDPKGTNKKTMTTLKLSSVPSISNSIDEADDDNDITLDIISKNKILQVESNFNDYLLNIYDLQGKKLVSTEVRKNNSSIDMNTYSNGVYIIEAIKNNQRKTKKILL